MRVAVCVAGVMAATIGPTEFASGEQDRARFKVRCSVVDEILRVKTNGPDPTLTRDGDAIVVSDFRGDKQCSGGDPTVSSIDRIAIDEADLVRLDMRAGLFAPGATPEPDGTSEIEIEVSPGLGNAVEILLGSEAQRVRLGSLEGGGSGVNLNAEVESGSKDPDVTADRPFLLDLRAGPGDDEISARGGGGFSGAWAGGVFVGGGSGSDRLVAPRRYEVSALVGGPGDDEILGGPGFDLIAGGPGRDDITARGGGDIVALGDGERDRADCGKGRDFVTSDRKKDQLSGCERRVKPGR